MPIRYHNTTPRCQYLVILIPSEPANATENRRGGACDAENADGMRKQVVK